MESGFAYDYRNITKDMKDDGETCGKNRVHRIMKAAGIRSQRGYKHHLDKTLSAAINTGMVPITAKNTINVATRSIICYFSTTVICINSVGQNNCATVHFAFMQIMIRLLDLIESEDRANTKSGCCFFNRGCRVFIRVQN